MAEQTYRLDADGIRRLKRLLDAFESGTLENQMSKEGKTLDAPVETYIAKTTSTLTAFTGSTAGSGTATFYKLNGSTLETASVNVTLWNFGAAIDSGEYVTTTRDPYSGKYVAVSCR